MSETPAQQSNVFLVDDDEKLLDLLALRLDVLGFQSRAFSNPKRFLDYYRSEMPGCLVLDVHMPQQSGLDLYERLIREGKRLPVIFTCAYADVSTAVAAMKSGAVEFLEKPLDHDKLLECVRKALALDAQWRKRDTDYAAIAERVRKLTQREWETLQLIQAGESNKSMAAKLFLTERAVEMRRSAIMKKLQVRSIAELHELVTTHRILTELRQTEENSLPKQDF